MERPTFAACRSADSPEYYVRIVWPHGEEHRIVHFGYREHAERWIENQAEYWYRLRAGRPRAPSDRHLPCENSR